MKPYNTEDRKMNKGKLLCELNNCSDGQNQQYPECELRMSWPNICPKSLGSKEILEALNSHEQLVKALRSICNELGVPQPTYPQPVTNAVEIATEALGKLYLRCLENGHIKEAKT